MLMSRKQELIKIIEDSTLFTQLIDEIIFIENQLVELKKLPFISVNPRNNAQQKATPASKQYKELLQQYLNCIKVLARASGQDMDDEESPLREWIRKRSDVDTE